MRSDIYYIKIFFAIAVSLVFGLCSSTAAVQSLETSLTSLVSALVGGVISSLAFSFVVLAQIFKKTNKQEKDLKNRYQTVIKSLLMDVHFLIWCLAGAFFLPVTRHINFPLLSYPKELSKYLDREQFFTSIEYFLAIVSISILFEVFHCMFETFIHDSLND